MNYLTPVVVNSHQNASAKTDAFKNCNAKTTPAKDCVSVGREKGGLLTHFLMISCLALAIMPKNSMASSGHDIFSSVIFCENECSEFVSIPASVGIVIGGLAGVPVGMGLGVPVAVGMGTAVAVLGHKPEEILHVAYSGIGLSTFIVAAVGAQVISHVVAIPFWVTEKVVYDAPLKIVNLVRNNF